MQEVAHRRPYEVLMLLQPVASAKQQPTAQCEVEHALACDDMTEDAALVQPNLVMIAVPGVHSRKPQLAQLLQAYLPESPRCLEVSDINSV